VIPTATSASAVELAPGSLYALGEVEPLDGRLTWVPRDERGYLPFNAYLLVEGTRALLVDAGVTKHAPTLLRQLDEILPPDATLDLFLTRSELDCGSAVRAIAEARRIGTLYGGGVLANPFAGLGWVAYVMNDDPDDYRLYPDYQLARCPVGQALDLGSGPRFEVVQAAIKVLAAYWAYDRSTRTLFTSDVFGHGVLKEPDGPRVVHTAAEAGDREQIARHLFTKFEWLLQADTAVTLQLLDSAFTQRPIDRIAPDRGQIIAGEDAVREVYETVRDLIVTRGGSEAP
jgi:flavorubredoxin